jgi:hypothetical protein
MIRIVYSFHQIRLTDIHSLSVLVRQVLVEQKGLIGHFEFLCQYACENIVLFQKVVENHFHVHKLSTVDGQIHHVNQKNLEINGLINLGSDCLLLSLW